MQRLIVDPDHPSSELMAAAAVAVRRGAVVGIPTDTLYGLAVNPCDAAAVAAAFRLKGRAADQPLPLIAADTAQVVACLAPLGPAGDRLAQRYWPGPLTLLIPAPPQLAPNVLAGQPMVGVRVPDHAVARALCLAAGTPVTATSANRSGAPPTNDPDVVAATLSGLDVLVDGGPTPGGPPSTIVSVAAGRPPILVRAGAIPWEDILACLERDHV